MHFFLLLRPSNLSSCSFSLTIFLHLLSPDLLLLLLHNHIFVTPSFKSLFLSLLLHLSIFNFLPPLPSFIVRLLVLIPSSVSPSNFFFFSYSHTLSSFFIFLVLSFSSLFLLRLLLLISFLLSSITPVAPFHLSSPSLSFPSLFLLRLLFPVYFSPCTLFSLSANLHFTLPPPRLSFPRSSHLFSFSISTILLC